MKTILKLILRLTFLLMFTVSCTSSANAQIIDDSLKHELSKMEQDLIIRLKAHDTTALNSIVSNDYQLMGLLFRTVSHDQWMRNCLIWNFDSATISEISVKSWENVAVLRSWQKFYNLVIGVDPIEHTEAWITDLFMKRNGKWQLVTRVSERPPN